MKVPTMCIALTLLRLSTILAMVAALTSSVSAEQIPSPGGHHGSHSVITSRSGHRHLGRHYRHLVAPTRHEVHTRRTRTRAASGTSGPDRSFVRDPGAAAEHVKPRVGPSPTAIRTGVDGTAVLWPAAPVQRRGMPDTRPFANATVTVRKSAAGPDIAQTVADSDGHFHMDLPPGHYWLTASPEPPGRFMGRSHPDEIDVSSTGRTVVTFRQDTGMR